MSTLRQIAWVTLILVFFISLFADLFAPAFYATQFRDSPGAPPSRKFPLGADELGRDWGSLLRELENIPLVMANPWMLASPALLLIVMSCFQIILPEEGSP